tara:strand:- start:1574 stop:3397 length:1824 start_codon:yes stop_codon:yes gene_type:complete
MDKNKFIPFKETFNHISFGMRAVAQTSAGIKGALKDRLKAKNTQIRKERLNAHRMLQKQKRDDQETVIEAGAGKPNINKKNPIAKRMSNFWEGLMTIFGSVIGAWLINKLPEIIEMIQDFWKRISTVIEAVKNIWTSVVDVTLQIGDVLKAFVDDLVNFNFFSEESKLKAELKELDSTMSDANKTWDKSIKDIKHAMWNFGQKGDQVREESKSNAGSTQSSDKTYWGEGYDGWSLDRINSDGFENSGSWEIPVFGRNSGTPYEPLTVTRPGPFGMGNDNKVAGILVDSDGNFRVKWKGAAGSTFGAPTLLETKNGEVVWYDKNIPDILRADGSESPLTEKEKELWLNTIRQSIDAYMEKNPKRIELKPIEEPKGQGGTRIKTTNFFAMSENRVIGYTGGALGHPGSGSSTGEHLHVEAGGGTGEWLGVDRYMSADAAFDDILVAGKPLSAYTSNSPPGPRKHPVTGEDSYHKGYDFAMPAGLPITLREGSDLRFRDYDPGRFDPSGHGYNVVVDNIKTGESYILSHLSGGPDPITKAKKQLTSANVGQIPTLTIDDEEGETIIVPVPINSLTTTPPPTRTVNSVAMSSSSGSGDVLSRFRSYNSNWT